MQGWPRIVLHADMDAFYASVEQRDNPRLRGRPVLVGPNSHRGVVLAASYEARRHGVGSAMPVARARQLCPHAVMAPPRFARYQEVSQQVMATFADFSPKVEALSLDEAFLDMSGAEGIFGPPAAMGQRLKAAVREATGLNISVGISGTKHVAKAASAHDKPDGLTIVPPQQAKAWLAPLPVAKLWGAGPKTAAALVGLGLATIGDVAAADTRFLHERLGGLGLRFHELANARDPRPVHRARVAKSIGSDRTLEADVSRREDIELHLRRSAERIARRTRAKGWLAGAIRIRLKTARFQMLIRQRRLRTPSDSGTAFLAAAKSLLPRFEHPGPFRLVGMAAFSFSEREGPTQLDFFEDDVRRRLDATVDGLLLRFGNTAVMRARDVGHPGTVQDGVNLDFLDAPAELTR